MRKINGAVLPRTIKDVGQLGGTNLSCVSRDPLIAQFDVRSLDRGPGDPMGNFLLPHIAGMRGKGVVEGFAVDILRVIRKASRTGEGRSTLERYGIVTD